MMNSTMTLTGKDSILLELEVAEMKALLSCKLLWLL